MEEVVDVVSFLNGPFLKPLWWCERCNEHEIDQDEISYRHSLEGMHAQARFVYDRFACGLLRWSTGEKARQKSMFTDRCKTRESRWLFCDCERFFSGTEDDLNAEGHEMKYVSSIIEEDFQALTTVLNIMGTMPPMSPQLVNNYMDYARRLREHDTSLLTFYDETMWGILDLIMNDWKV